MFFTAFWLLCLTCASNQMSDFAGGISQVQSDEAEVLVENSAFGVILRDSGIQNKSNEVFYGFLEQKYGAPNLYRFHSIEALRKGRADAVYLFHETKQCVPNSAVIYNDFLYCRLFTNKFDEYLNPISNQRKIEPVIVGVFNLTCESKQFVDICKRSDQVQVEEVSELTMDRQILLFRRLPSKEGFSLGKFDLKITGSLGVQMNRPNMNIRFHVDSLGMWLLAPYESGDLFSNPVLRRYQIDPVSLKIERSYVPGNTEDTSQTEMMNIGPGVMVNGWYYGIERIPSRNSNMLWFRQRPRNGIFTKDFGPYRKERDSKFTITKDAKRSHLSHIQLANGQLQVALTDLTQPYPNQHTHYLVPLKFEL